MTQRLMTLFFASALVLGLASLSFAQTCQDIHDTPNGCAPSPLDGSPVTVTGTVYVPAGTYNSGSVYFQCGAGGLTFFDSSALVEEGDVIEVSGTVGAFGDEIQINGASWSVVGSDAAETTFINTGDLFAGGNFLGDFMRVEGILAKVSSGFNSVYTVDDGSGPVIVFIDGTTGIDTTVWDSYVGDLVSVIGSTKCFNGEGEILPRRDEDLQLVTVPTEVDSWGAIKSRF